MVSRPHWEGDAVGEVLRERDEGAGGVAGGVRLELGAELAGLDEGEGEDG